MTSHQALIPLQGVRIEACLTGLGSEVTVTQRYTNLEAVDVEAVYVFPLAEGAAVCGFTARVGDRLIRGRVEEREKAFEVYDDAMAAGHGAFLLDQERPNIFTVSVGNLRPQQTVEIAITYVTPLCACRTTRSGSAGWRARESTSPGDGALRTDAHRGDS